MRSFDASTQAPSLWPTQVFRTLDRELGDYFVIGSIARDLWAHVAAGLPPGRLTEDIDVSVAVASLTELRKRTAGLDGPNAGGVRYLVGGVRVDVIPYGPIEDRNLVEPAEGVVLDVTGMHDAAATRVAVTVGPGLVVQFASLPAMIALKLVAWGMRRASTDKDARDLALLLDACHSGLFEESCWTDEPAAARWDYDPALVGPYRMGIDLAAGFSNRSVGRLVQLLTGTELDRLVAQVPKRAVPRDEQFRALRAGLDRG